jgi:signal transduction histidine kinase
VARIVRGITVTEETGTPATALELASVNSVVSELVRMALGTLFVPNKVNVQIDLNPDVPPLPLQKDLLKQVLFNLAKNAVEAMHAGGHPPSPRLVDAAASARSRSSRRHRPAAGLGGVALFEPVVSKGGDHAGLGLAISRGLVERIGNHWLQQHAARHRFVRLPPCRTARHRLRPTRRVDVTAPRRDMLKNSSTPARHGQQFPVTLPVASTTTADLEGLSRLLAAATTRW